MVIGHLRKIDIEATVMGLDDIEMETLCRKNNIIFSYQVFLSDKVSFNRNLFIPLSREDCNIGTCHSWNNPRMRVDTGFSEDRQYCSYKGVKKYKLI